MKKPATLFSYISNAVCFLLLLVMLATQFMPFWLCEDCKNHEEAKQITIAEYTWFPKEHTPITKGMTDVYLNIYGDGLLDEKGKPFKFQANDTVIPCIIIFVACILSVIMLIKNPGNTRYPIFPLIAGVGGVVGYLTIAALQTGENWQIHLVAAIVLTVVSGAVVLCHLVKMLRKTAVRKANAKKCRPESGPVDSFC